VAEKIKYATFYLNGIYFGVPAVAVQEVLERQVVVNVPLAPPALPGVINLRGQILTVMDLRERLQLAPREDQEFSDSRMAVIRTHEGPLTLLIDRVGEICDVDTDCFEQPAETIRPNVRAVVSHLCKLDAQLLLVLDIVRLSEIAPAVPRPPEAAAPQV
jgi:purine-binding chemotaxis protein CheW